MGVGRESRLIVGVGEGKSTNCWSGRRECRLIVGLEDSIVGVGDGRVD